MNRGVWFLMGGALGAYGVTKIRRTAEAFTYDGLTDRLSGLFVGARLFSAEVMAAAAEKETELRERLEPMPHGSEGRELEASTGSTSRVGDDGRVGGSSSATGGPLTVLRGSTD